MSVNKTVENYRNEYDKLTEEEVRTRLQEVVNGINTYSSYLEPLEAQLVALLDVADDYGYGVDDLVTGYDDEESDPA